MSRIFISYRREDSSGYAGHLQEKLGPHFGRDNVFMDIDTIEPGLDFVETIQQAVGSCAVLLAIIGRYWLSSTDATGQRRLEDPEDYVRLEITTALERNIRVIPVLVGGAVIPSSIDLPDVLKRLARRHALEISDQRFDYDVGRLIQAVERALDGPTPASSALTSPRALDERVEHPEPTSPGEDTDRVLADMQSGPTVVGHAGISLIERSSQPDQPSAAARQPFEPELIRIPAGEFLMGSDPQKDKAAEENEQPQHHI